MKKKYTISCNVFFITGERKKYNVTIRSCSSSSEAMHKFTKAVMIKPGYIKHTILSIDESIDENISTYKQLLNLLSKKRK